MKKNFIRKVDTLVLFMVFFTQCAVAMDDYGHYWFHNHISAYPIGKGFVYGTDEPDISSNSLTMMDWRNEMTCKYTALYPEAPFYAYAKPLEGYQTVGWYSKTEDGKPGDFLIKNPLRSLPANDLLVDDDPLKVEFNGFSLFDPMMFFNKDLAYIWTEEDSEEEGYNPVPDNDLMAVFGKVGIEMHIDNVDGLKELVGLFGNDEAMDSLKLTSLFVTPTWSGAHPYMSKPANDIGDRIELGVENTNAFKEVLYGKKDSVCVYVYSDYVEVDGKWQEVEVYDTVHVYEDDYDKRYSVSVDFSHWSNDQGDAFYSPKINVDVVKLDTYVCHFILTCKLIETDSVEENIANLTLDNVPDSKVYSPQGFLVSNSGTKGLKPGIYIVRGKKVIVK